MILSILGYLKRKWQQIAVFSLILSIVVGIIWGSIYYNNTLRIILENFNLVAGPLIGIAGLALGYPILKRKLLDGYIITQFNDIYSNNKKVKKLCLRLKDKYPPGAISKPLTDKFLSEIIIDIKELMDLAIDSNVDVYNYTALVYRALCEFESRVGEKKSLYYCETISSLVNRHLGEIYKFSQSLGAIPKSSTKKKSILIEKMNSFVTDKYMYEVENASSSLSYRHSSAALVLYNSINLNAINDEIGIMYKSFFFVAQSPSPFARIMYNSSIYIPLALEGNELILGIKEQLFLVGYRTVNSQNMETSEVTIYYKIYYANMSSVGFVAGMMASQEALGRFRDMYLESEISLKSDAYDYNVEGEMITLNLSKEKAQEYFKVAKKQIVKKMRAEMQPQ